MSFRKLQAYCKAHPSGVVRIIYDAEECRWVIRPLSNVMSVEVQRKHILAGYNRKRDCWRVLRQLGYIRFTDYIWQGVSLKDRNHNVSASTPSLVGADLAA